MSQIVVLSRRNVEHSPAMCCLVELENVLVSDFGAELRCLPTVSEIRGATIFCGIMSFNQLRSVERDLERLKCAGNRVILYVFDCWDVSMLYSKRRALSGLLGFRLPFDQLVDRLCLPFRQAVEMLRAEHRAIARHVPLGVDTSLVNGENEQRPITVLGYGSQPAQLSRLLAETMNDPLSPFIFHHTDHMSYYNVTDGRLHRRHFWKLAQSSQLALTYDAAVTNPQRIPFSIVGQRFYESLAAGCVLVGRRPVTSEADELLNWPDAIIELPDEPSEAVEKISQLHMDAERLARIRERNVLETRRRHDWRYRIPLMLAP